MVLTGSIGAAELYVLQSIRRLVAAMSCIGLVLGCVACRGDSAADDGDATGVPSSSVETESASSVFASATPTTVQLDDACGRAPDTDWATFGTVNTIIVPVEADVIDVRIVPTPVAVCPGGTFAVELTVTNRGDIDVVFAPNRGLLLQSGGMTNWEIAPIAPASIAGGTTAVIQLAATIPNVEPGQYTLGAEGFAHNTAFDILPPTG